MLRNVLNYVHDPAAKLDYGYSWESWLATGETISTVVATATAPGAVLTGTTVVHPADQRVSTTVVSTVSTWVDFHITTSAARQDSRSIRLLVAKR